ncbi:hypothetical protein [Rhizobacter sp. Root1221]|uniref:hypothetical protein n=1 Tax=Rhizobacter sp. Root1221 TaxID=1736433 RepID=UPI000700A81A|nr:hypothetical protein [Rhizobacter sp. Root1221]KQV99967.1 hypothetical protein ASC87_19900 [Rhizobacter sp. Root1221]
MAGQRERQFNPNGPARYDDVGTAAAAPTVNTTPFKPTAASVSEAPNPHLARLGNSLSSFFQTGAQVAQGLGEIAHREEMNRIQVENKNLELQGQIDRKGGKTMAPEYANREAYAGAFERSAADTQAFDLTEKFKVVLDGLPRDGTQDPMAAAESFWKQEIGTGTGDRQYDAQLMGRFTNNVQAMVSKANNEKLQDQEATATNTIFQNFTGKLQGQNGVTSGDVADVRGQIMTVTRGDPIRADKLMGTLAAQVQNQRQALSFLNALNTPDAEDGSSWASRNTATYDDLSRKALQQVTQVKSIEAYNEVSRWTQDLYSLQSNPAATLTDYAKLYSRGVDIDYRHGVGNEPFGHLFTAMRAASKQKANVNLQVAAMRGTFGSNNMAPGEAAVDRQVTERERELGYAEYVKTTPGFETLAQTTGRDGLINPQASDAAMVSFANLFAAQSVQATHEGSLMAGSLKSRAFGPLTGNDPQAAARAWAGAKQMERNGVQGSLLSKVFPNAEAEQMYRSMDAFMADGTDPASAFKAMRDDPLFQKFLGSGQSTGNYNLSEVVGVSGADAAKLSQDINKKIVGLGRTVTDSNDWPGFRKDVGMAPAVRAEVMALLYKDAVIQKTNGSSYDVDKAFENIGATIKGRYLALPSNSGGLQLVRNPFGDRGQAPQSPLNLAGPLATSKGFKPIYAGVPMMNRVGKVEDPKDTMAEDMKALTKALPNLAPDTTQAYVSAPDQNGLMTFFDRRGQQIQFVPGQMVDVPKEGVEKSWLPWTDPAIEKAPVPKDPAQAVAFFQKRLPPGYYVDQSGFIDPATQQPAYVLKYGFRLIGDEEAARRAAGTAERSIDDRNAAIAREKQNRTGYTSEGGAAFGITPSAGRRGF